tara:strand:+ start:361 stop:573 length:213 start_codon:yes stop_codon:yes gene_type:complete
MTYTEDDIGKIVEIETETGRYIEERIVHVFCRICGSNFIGIMREAGGFVAGHKAYHAWEFEKEIATHMEA